MKKMIIGFLVLLIIVLLLSCTREIAKNNETEKPIEPKIEEKKEVETKEPIKEEKLEEKEEPKKPKRTPQLVEELEGNETLQVHFLSVGHGDSILIIAPGGGTMLVDGGYEDQPRRIVAYLENLSINYFDVMLATHSDADHTGGLDYIMKKMAYIHRIIDSGFPENITSMSEHRSYVSFLKHAEKKSYEVLKENTDITIDDDILVQLFVPYYDGFLETPNDNSIITRIDYGDVSFLLMGDCEFACEKNIMAVNNVDADILKVGHHGDDDATSEEFLDAVSPQLAIISTGDVDKFFGHPGVGTLRRLEGIKTMRTDLDGNIVVETDGKDYRIFIKEEVKLPEFTYT